MLGISNFDYCFFLAEGLRRLPARLRKILIESLRDPDQLPDPELCWQSLRASRLEILERGAVPTQMNLPKAAFLCDDCL
jgi:hypothetical protein